MDTVPGLSNTYCYTYSASTKIVLSPNVEIIGPSFKAPRMYWEVMGGGFTIMMEEGWVTCRIKINAPCLSNRATLTPRRESISRGNINPQRLFSGVFTISTLAQLAGLLIHINIILSDVYISSPSIDPWIQIDTQSMYMMSANQSLHLIADQNPSNGPNVSRQKFLVLRSVSLFLWLLRCWWIMGCVPPVNNWTDAGKLQVNGARTYDVSNKHTSSL